MTEWTPCAKDAAGWKDATVPDDACSQYLRSVGFDPLPKQYDFITCPADDVGFGGARGGAKSHAILGDWLWHEKQYGNNAIGLVIRRERTQLVELVERAKKVFAMTGLKFAWKELDKTFIGPEGSRLKFAFLDNDGDADKYQGHEYSRIYPEERGTFPREEPMNKLQATLRSGAGVPCQMKSTMNPGGPGHQHCLARYRLDTHPQGYEIFNIEVENPWTKAKIIKRRIFIPSKITDNKFLGDDYVANLFQVGSPQLVKAWLEGDWSIIEGAFFDGWRGEHVIEEFQIPEHWMRFRSMRWGSAKPFSIGWWAVASDDFIGRDFEGRDNGQRIPKGALVRYREWYGSKPNQTDVGMKLEAERIAAGIIERTPRGEKITYTVASPQIFQSDYGPSISERLMRSGVVCFPADDHFAKEVGRSGGWDQLRARLVGQDGVPAIFCFKNCADSVRTIPALQHDRKNPEEVDDESELHAAADWRYAAMSRPWITQPKRPRIPDGVGFYGDANGVTHSTLTVRQMIDRMEKKRKAEID